MKFKLLITMVLVVIITSVSFSQKPATKRQVKMIRTQGEQSGNVYCCLQDKAGHLWFSTSGEGVYRYDGTYFTNFTKKDGLRDNDVSAIIQVQDGTILFATSSGICKYDGTSFSNYSENAEVHKISATCLLEDREGILWLGTRNNGVYRYDGSTVTNYLNHDDHPFNLGTHYQTISDIAQDRNGTIWISSWNGGGVWRYDGKTFTNFLPSAEYYRRNEDGRSGGSITSPALPALIDNGQVKSSISDDMIFSITEDRAGNLWFATRRHGACRYDGKFFTSFRENEGFVSKGIYAIAEDRKGNIWLTTEENGVWCYDGTSFKNVTTKDGLINDSVFSVFEDTSGNLWFGTRGFGLCRYDGKAFTSFSE